jgi:hypothetical protein
MIDERRWALGRVKLEAVKNNLPSWIYEPQVAECHQIVDLLQQASGEDLAPFRISESQLKQQVIGAVSGSRRRPGQVFYGDKKQCPPDLMLRQLDGLLAYVDIIQPQARGYRITHG